MNSAHALWFLTRGTGLVAMVLVTLSVLAGITASLRVGGTRTPRFVVAGLHRNLSLMTVAFIAVHVVTTVLDAYAPIRFVDAVVPFASAYRPVWLGLGALASDIILALVITSLVRVRIGLRTWRGIHWFAYACFPITILHALGTGSDASRPWMLWAVGGCIAAVTVAILARLWQVQAERANDLSGAVILRLPSKRLGLRLLGTAMAVAVPLATAAWAVAGPLAPHWASRAGTPTSPTASKNSLAALAAQQTAIERLRTAQIRIATARVNEQVKQVHAALAAVAAASRPIPVSAPVASGGGGGGGGSTYAPASGSSGGGSSAVAAAPAPAPVAAPTPAPVAVSGGS